MNLHYKHIKSRLNFDIIVNNYNIKYNKIIILYISSYTHLLCIDRCQHSYNLKQRCNKK